MGVSGFIVLVVLSWSLFVIPRTQQLQASETQVLLQLRKHLEYPPALDAWGSYTEDICNIQAREALGNGGR
ncbi:hypothetical protein CDL15_Pgr004285 [Punica granatum]|uniref:Uncharacterized protein n=1 Tax=Punica granatum TaxID=22663 RepID=A0A218XG06_PUNGR|nr:hypothetical protein CDL15_Pgr004285 [Punica granatum]